MQKSFEIVVCSDANGHYHDDPICTVLTVTTYCGVNPELFMKGMHKLELNQLGANRRGGRAEEIVEDLHNLGIECSLKPYRRKSTFDSEALETMWQYNLISGNY